MTEAYYNNNVSFSLWHHFEVFQLRTTTTYSCTCSLPEIKYRQCSSSPSPSSLPYRLIRLKTPTAHPPPHLPWLCQFPPAPLPLPPSPPPSPPELRGPLVLHNPATPASQRLVAADTAPCFSRSIPPWDLVMRLAPRQSGKQCYRQVGDPLHQPPRRDLIMLSTRAIRGEEAPLADLDLARVD